MQTTSFKSSTTATSTTTATTTTRTPTATATATATFENSHSSNNSHSHSHNPHAAHVAWPSLQSTQKQRLHTTAATTATTAAAGAATGATATTKSQNITNTNRNTTTIHNNFSSNKCEKPYNQSQYNNHTNNISKNITKATTIRIGILCIILQLNVYFHHITATSLMHINDYLNTERPYFDDVNARNVSAVTDERVVLKCRVKNKGNRTVSWMRKRDLHILTTNIYTYTGDQRFSVLHSPNTDDWDLKIDYAQQRDSGIYECQVNTEPKINLAIVLEVHAATDVKSKSADTTYYDAKAARAKILGSTEIHVKRDSTIALACSVNMHASSVAWYHGASIVDFDSLRGGISLETEKTEIGTTSRLMLTRASLRDSGNYTCVPNGAIPASVRVHVLTGEQPAAMQTSNAAAMTASINIKSTTKFMITTTQYTTICVLLCVGTLILWQLIIISQSTSIQAVNCMQLQQPKQQQLLLENENTTNVQQNHHHHHQHPHHPHHQHHHHHHHYQKFEPTSIPNYETIQQQQHQEQRQQLLRQQQSVAR